MPRSITRRRWLHTSLAASGTIATLGYQDLWRTMAAETSSSRYTPLNGFPRMVQDYYVDIARDRASPKAT